MNGESMGGSDEWQHDVSNVVRSTLKTFGEMGITQDTWTLDGGGWRSVCRKWNVFVTEQ
jgi:hypothetical protein